MFSVLTFLQKMEWHLFVFRYFFTNANPKDNTQDGDFAPKDADGNNLRRINFDGDSGSKAFNGKLTELDLAKKMQYN